MGPASDLQSPICLPSSSESLRGSENAFAVPMTSARLQRGAQSANQASSANSTSWRSNAAPLPPISPRRPPHSPLTPLVTFPSASQVLGVQLLNASNDESLEEVEFTDLGKFVGMEPNPEEPVVPLSPRRDILTDTDQPSPTRTKSDLEPSWRRKAPFAPVEEQPHIIVDVLLKSTPESLASAEVDAVPASPTVPTTSIGASSPVKPLAEGFLPGQTLAVPSSQSSQRSPRTSSYREELISTFDDTMSRIKGAMQTNPRRNTPGTENHTDRANGSAHFADQPRFSRAIPPTPRSHHPRVREPNEPFTTMTELDDDTQRGQPSRVSLPSLSRALEPLSKRELANLRRSILPMRWEVLSWDPPVEGMSIRDYSINSVLFDKSPLPKSRPRFSVKLPPSGSYLIRRSSPAVPKVHLPAKPLVNKTVAATGAFGRPRAADESSTWRRTLPPILDQIESVAGSEGLVTRSGSSPPDTDKASDVTSSIETDATLPAPWPTKTSRAEPKMPAGAGVAFYRESTSCPSVSFTVSSELEDVKQPETPVIPLPTEESTPVSQPLGDSKGNEVDGSSTLVTSREKAESKSSDGSVSMISAFSEDI